MSIARRFAVVCDECGTTSDEFPTSAEAKVNAKKANWRVDQKHLCPNCRTRKSDSPLTEKASA